MTFSIETDGGMFRYDDGIAAAVEALDRAIEDRESGGLSLTRYIAVLKDIIADHPDYIDGYAHLGFALKEQGKPKLALQACLSGYELGQAHMPVGFSGPIAWVWHENRPFLRAAQGLATCYSAIGRNRDAVVVMENLLRWNPSDNQGIRYMIGGGYLRLGDVLKASLIFDEEADHYPPYQYQLALIYLKQGRLTSAATRLRQAFTANGYIAEILCGNPEPAPLAIWHASNLAGPVTARDYVDAEGVLWRQTPNALAFLHWLYNHPKVLAERAVVLGFREALLWEYDLDARRALLDSERAAIAAIDDQLSDEIVVEHRDRSGQMHKPWLYPGLRPSRY
ncbi:tetratricopeptide repeat protein [Asticcacaulis benevestitus]|uniref:tetratricopeptide repeat protein n=1 Tax=Asticcacaulis benevestitus TaxID=347481 RepID=UPI0003A0C41F|nr:hypothetical protein [Asticcacaulis benevestitus]